MEIKIDLTQDELSLILASLAAYSVGADEKSVRTDVMWKIGVSYGAAIKKDRDGNSQS